MRINIPRHSKAIRIIRDGVEIGDVTVHICYEFIFMHNNTCRDLSITVTVNDKWKERLGGILSAGEKKKLKLIGGMWGDTSVWSLKILKIETEDVTVRGEE
jgi:hypothetical protein